MNVATQWWSAFVNIMKMFSFADVCDIAITAFILYHFIKLIRETRASQLVKGILILVGGYFLSSQLNFIMLKNLLNKFFEFAVITFLVVFQPELRNALEQIGRSKLGTRLNYIAATPTEVNKIINSQKFISTLTDSVIDLQKNKTGALIVLERETKLGDVINTGTVVDAALSVTLLGNIFFNKAPLHDGAAVVRNDKLYAAGCILPLTSNKNISAELGTRHRAALGISEISDAIAIVVSEETGSISLAIKGIITRNYNKETLKNKLNEIFLSSIDDADLKKQILKSIKKFKYVKKTK